MTGFDFISVGIKLSNSTAEGELRTAVSRAYYGAFHIAKDLLKECGITLIRGMNPHEKVCFCLDNCTDENARYAGSNLTSLRAIRNEADYDFESDRFTNRRKIAPILQGAHEVVDAIAMCRQNLGTLQEELRVHARRLGLNVVGEDQ